MFRSPADQVAQPWDRVAAWLRARGHDVDDLAPRQFAGGVANLNYLVQVDGGPAVLRRPPSGELAEGASDMAREARVLAALPAAYPLAPRLLELCEDRDVVGAPFQLLEHRSGTGVGADVPAGWPVDGVVDEVVLAMARLHDVDPAAVGLEGLGRPGFLARQVAGWRRRGDAAWAGSPPRELAVVLDHLAERVPPEPARPALLHCDLKPDNMLFEHRDGRPEAVAVLDWDMTTVGDPLFDLGVLLAYWVEPGDPEPLHALRQVPSLVPGAPSRADVAARYLRVAGGPATDPRDLSFHVTLGRVRLAVAWRQLHVLHTRGTTTDPRYAGFDGLATAVLAWTADQLSGSEHL